MRQLASVLKALGDETRLRMLALLQAEGELCVCDVVEALQITQSKASRHLRHLVNAGFVQDRKDGVWVHFRIAQPAEALQAAVLAALSDQLARRLGDEVVRCLADWRKRKAREGISCSESDR